MSRLRKKKTPITKLTTSPSSSAKPQSTRAVIRQFHVHLKKQAQGQTRNGRPETLGADLGSQVEQVGGLQEYQEMSVRGQGNDRGGGCEKVLIGWLLARDQKAHCTKSGLRLLEVGALLPDNYRSCASWIDVTPIDLHSRHPAILEQDFLQMDDASNMEKWDILSLSLVLNFVPDAHERGRMLRKCAKFLKRGAFLFLTLPLPCVRNSRYVSLETLVQLMQSLGLELVEERWREGGKLAYWLFCKMDSEGIHPDGQQFRTKRVLLSGKSRNNFAILM
ncbi:hypothetical protein SISSUDRAFT_1013156 [Sistotremastrum suecicum HHB10207 ss-3]|uniref:25S rRNA adenine-N(1) methyltransferase n=1 Tax=Sistotremastrum suecicum HHB10207 ss-3 TaxID=1314776 RepID=A0A166IUR2_9AGAM|nr:hypothetical protein SISSUDRAFT_1013156 [Sistotremastrum suecicum HHB10207 ss-3]